MALGIYGWVGILIMEGILVYGMYAVNTGTANQSDKMMANTILGILAIAMPLFIWALANCKLPMLGC